LLFKKYKNKESKKIIINKKMALLKNNNKISHKNKNNLNNINDKKIFC